MERFCENNDGYKPLTVFGKHFILDVSQGFEYASTSELNLKYFTQFLEILATQPTIWRSIRNCIAKQNNWWHQNYTAVKYTYRLDETPFWDVIISPKRIKP